MSDFERYRVRNQRLKALENLYNVTKRVFNQPKDHASSGRMRLLADLQEAIEKVERYPVPKQSDEN